jgi:hypothetical protein
MRRILIVLAALAALPSATRVFDPRGVIGMLPRTGSVVLKVLAR